MIIIAEVSRLHADEKSSALSARSRSLKKAGVHALCVRTDADDTACGLKDLFAVVHAVPEIPVLRRDWFIHPLQVRYCLDLYAGAWHALHGCLCSQI
jgi:indole-3-glycerol phosphate synthase